MNTKIQWVFVGAVLILPLFFSEKLVAFNPWGLALVKFTNPHATEASFSAQHFGTFIALFCAVVVFMIYAPSQMGAMRAFVMSAVAFSLLNWLTFYACGALFLVGGVFMLRTGGEMAGLVAEDIGQQIEIGRANKALEIGEMDPETGMIFSYRYVFDDGKGPPLSLTATGMSRGGVWHGGFLQADRMPTLRNKSGIYSCKSPHDPELDYYADSGRRLVKIKNWGKVVEHKRGYRSQYAQIIEWLS